MTHQHLAQSVELGPNLISGGRIECRDREIVTAATRQQIRCVRDCLQHLWGGLTWAARRRRRPTGARDCERGQQQRLGDPGDQSVPVVHGPNDTARGKPRAA